MSQSRGVCLDSCASLNTPEVTEIKTSNCFKDQDIIAVLIPQALFTFLSDGFVKTFKDKIIPVPNTHEMLYINKLPNMLETLHEESIAPRMFQTKLPDYESILLKQILPKHKKFSLHAVRLHTMFDFAPRYVENLKNARQLLQQAKAGTIVTHPDGSGWVLVHKTKLINYNPNLNLPISKRLDPKETRKGFKAAQGESKMVLSDDILSAAAENGLGSIPGITAVVIDYYDALFELKVKPITMVTFNAAACTIFTDVADNTYIAEETKKQLEKMGQEATARKQKEHAEALEKQLKAKAEAELLEKRIAAALTIQGFMRTKWARQAFIDYKKATGEQTAAELALKNAKLKLEETTVKFEQTKAKVLSLLPK